MIWIVRAVCIPQVGTIFQQILGAFFALVSSANFLHVHSTKHVWCVTPLTLWGHYLHWGSAWFSNADWATCPKDHISITGYCWFYHGGVVSHVSRKQSTQALSSIEAEYMAIAAAFQEGLWLRTFFQSLSIPFSLPIRLYVNNAGAVALSREASNNHHTKHIDIWFHFCRSHIKSGLFSTEWLASSKNTADILTKVLPRPIFSRHVSGLSLMSH